jgi:anamorsin
MAPTAIYSTPAQELHKVVAAVPSKGPALAIGSPATAQDGKYQALVTELQGSRAVEKQMLDRLIDSGA